MRRAAPGPQVSSGRLRVDAGKAIAKLREYQLTDRSAWVLEALRAAVAAHATRIELAADANDVWLAWQGEPWPTEVLPRLFDELVSPEAASELHHVRLLAAAVNSALGMAPAHFDVVSIRDGNATRVRYTPEILVEPESDLGESALRHVAAESIARPEHAPASGMYLHLRRRLADWRVFSEAPELTLARAACRDIAVPLHIDELVLHRDHATDVVRLPLGGGVDGFIAITELERAGAAAMLEVAERGVVLATYALAGVADDPRGKLPIRVFVDAPRMPTNASRSQVRRDTFPIADAERRAVELLPALYGELAKAVQQGSERARSSALALLAAHAGGPQWHVDVPAFRGPLRELAQLPLVHNAVGQPRALTSHWRAEVHTGKQPFSTELAPWLDTVLWAPPGDPAQQLLAGAAVDSRGTRRLARYARSQLRAQKQFFAHTKREIRVLSSVEPHIRVPLGIEVERSGVGQDWFAGLTGEVCIYRDGHVGALAILLEGRLLDRIEYDSPLAFDVVIDSARVTPGERYRGVKHDSEYTRVERAMRAGLARALESHALANRDRDDADLDGRLFRRGFGVFAELGLPVRGPLAAAPAYRTVDNQWLSLAELGKESVLGVAPVGKPVAVPRGRVVVALDNLEHRALVGLVKARVIAYRRSTGASAQAFASSLAGTGAGGALIVQEPGVVAALTPSPQARVRLHHMGVELAETPYLSSWLPCAIDLDCDAIVPNDEWTGVADDGGVRSRDFGPWELALVRSIACAVIGERPAELITTAQAVELDSKLGRVLCDALARHAPLELLGPELHAKLRTARLLSMLGQPQPCSIVDAAAAFPNAIPVIERDAPPVADYTPLVAKVYVAAALARLVERDVVDGTPKLERLQREALRELRLTAHRGLPVQPMTIPADTVTPVEGSIARGLVGVWDRPFEIRVFVEGRPFLVIHPPDASLPLVAAVEISAASCGETFDAIPESTVRTIAVEVRAAIPALLAEIAKQDPHKLGDAGPVRALLVAAMPKAPAVRKLLAAAPAFHTIQGGRISVEQAAQPRLIISVAAWQGDWLGPDTAESPHALDAPIVFVPDSQHELSKIIDKLHEGSVVDVTDEVMRLQSRRRIARGLVPTPRVTNAPAALKRSLDAFGPLGKGLGVGEIALVEDTASVVKLFVDGNQRRSETIDVLPAVTVAVELTEPQSLAPPVQQLAIELVKQVLSTVAPESLPPRIQRNLLRAALSLRLDRDALAGLPLWRDLLDQIDKFTNAWVMLEPTEAKPLDDNRHVFFFEQGTFDLARQHGWPVIDATKELELDATARRNRARKPAASLELPSRDGVLGEELLAGDGVTSPRGVVAVLSPAYVHARGVWAHTQMHPFDRVEDPCRWPTLAVIDDARLAPDRTWQAPVLNDNWQAVAKELRLASERVLGRLGEPPADALVSLRITNHVCADVGALRKSPKSMIRGLVWLTGDPQRDVAIQVAGIHGVRSFTPNDRLSLGGKLLVYAADKLDVDAALQQLCGQVHAKLVRQLLKTEHVDRDLAAAHVAHALAIRTLRATDARGIEFSCFSPRPLDARGLTSLLRLDDRVTVIKPNTPPDPDPKVIEVFDDGSILARTVIAQLGSRVRRNRPAPQPRPVPQAPRVAPPATPPKQQPHRAPPPEPPHPLRSLVTKLRSRLSDLGIGGYRWSIIERPEPMFAFADEIEVAGDNVRLRALAAALASNSPFAQAGIDVVVAHLVTVLNVALTQITDASEAHALGVLLASPPGVQKKHRQGAGDAKPES